MKAGEPIGDIFIAYKGKHDPHKLVDAALAGTNSDTAGAEGKFGTSAAGATSGAIAGKVCRPSMRIRFAKCRDLTPSMHATVLR